MRIREYFLSVSQQLEEFNNMLQTQLETAHAEISTKAAEISQLREQGRAQTAEAKQLAEQKLRLEKKTQALEGQVEHFRPKATAIVDTFPGVDIRPLQEIISSSSSLSDALTDALDFGRHEKLKVLRKALKKNLAAAEGVTFSFVSPVGKRDGKDDWTGRDQVEDDSTEGDS